MHLNDFVGKLPTLWEGDPHNEHWPRERKFGKVIRETEGMATENKLALLNFAASCLSAGETYLEIGAFRGTTIIGAALGNLDNRFLTIDNFSEFDGQADECRRNLDRFGCSHVQLIEGDAWEVLRRGSVPSPVGVYFYDGRHMFRDQWAALERVEPLLADEAVVVIDDTEIRRAAAANELYTRDRPEYERIARFRSPWNGEPRWWNGLEVFAYRRASGVCREGGGRVRYAAYLGYYDVVRHYAGTLVGRRKRGGGPL